MKILLLPYILMGFFVGGTLVDLGHKEIGDNDKGFLIIGHIFLASLYMIVLWQVFKSKKFLGADRVFALYGLPGTYFISGLVAFLYFKYH
jgi:hypothetical protein